MKDEPIISIELVEDMKDLVKFNEDVQIEKSVEEKLNSLGNDDLIKVTKELGSLKIKDIELVNEELLKKEL